jgi:hypothetical protein
MHAIATGLRSLLPLLAASLSACTNPPEADDETQGDTETGDGDGDGDGEHWCDICANPSDGENCEANYDLHQSVEFRPDPETYGITVLDEACTVTTVTPSLIELDCETIAPRIHLDLVEPWTPNLAVDEPVRLMADGGDIGFALVVDWRIDRADESFALAGREAVRVFTSLGLEAIPIAVETGVCVPTCGSGWGVYEQAAMTFEFDGEQATLFKGGHAVVGNREIWVAEAKNLACDPGLDIFGWTNVFVSAVD